MNQVPSIVQILAAEMLAIWGTSSLVMALWNTVRPGAFGPAATLRGIGNWIWFLLGLALLVWLPRSMLTQALTNCKQGHEQRRRN